MRLNLFLFESQPRARPLACGFSKVEIQGQGHPGKKAEFCPPSV